MITPYHDERILHIYVPDDYEGKRFPVLYMFDGHNLFLDEDSSFGKSWGMKKYFDKHHVQAIVVGIECNHEGNLRLCEFSPYSFNDDVFGYCKATGKLLFKWMVEELKPYIDDNYPTLPDREHTIIGGSSMGGLMAIYGGMKYSHVFSKAACLSPFLEHVLPALKNDIRRTDIWQPTSFYMSWGRFEFRTKRNLAAGTEEILSISRLLTKKGADVYMHCYEFGSHSEGSWEYEIPQFLRDLEIR